MLLGSAPARIDAKGRLKVPAKFRALIEPRRERGFFVTSLNGISVSIYPMDTWQGIEDRLAEVSAFHPSVIRFRNTTNYFGQVAGMDAQGRILIHPLLRERARVDGDVAVLGQRDYLEVWNRRLAEQRLEQDPLGQSDLTTLSDLGV